MSDDRAGYKRPPTATRFRPGESGNPSGRPKRCPSFRETLLARLAAPAGGARHGNTKMQALVATLVDAAISGDARAQALVLGALTRFGESAEQEKHNLFQPMIRRLSKLTWGVNRRPSTRQAKPAGMKWQLARSARTAELNEYSLTIVTSRRFLILRAQSAGRS